MLSTLGLVLLAALALAALGWSFVRALLFWLVAVPMLVLGAWWLWQQDGIGWWALAALALGIPAAWYDARNADRP